MTPMTIARLCAVVLLVAALAGCQDGDEPPPEPTFANWPDTLQDFRFRWSAEPGVDLVSGPVVSLRAYLESYRIGQLTNDISAAYPGFERAVPAPLPPPYSGSTPAELVAIRPAPEAEPFGPPGPFYGNEYFHILELTPIEGGYRAYVCDGLYNIFRQGGQGEQSGMYVSVMRFESRSGRLGVNAIKVWRVEFTDAPPDPNAAAMVTVPQRGPNPAPVGDVFGPWRITGASDERWGTLITPEFTADETVDGARRTSQCGDRMPHDRAQREAIYTSKPDTPPAAEPAVPGWPNNTA
jgi:hypothetical protein